MERNLDLYKYFDVTDRHPSADAGGGHPGLRSFTCPSLSPSRTLSQSLTITALYAPAQRATRGAKTLFVFLCFEMPSNSSRVQVSLTDHWNFIFQEKRLLFFFHFYKMAVKLIKTYKVVYAI